MGGHLKKLFRRKSKEKLYDFPKGDPSFQLSVPKPRLVSFADGKFSKRKDQFHAEARQSNFFSDVNIYSFESLPHDFRTKHGAFMQENARGFGYWIWKPIVILEALKQTEPGDCVVYLDAGFTINPAGGRRFQEYIEIAQAHPSGMLSFVHRRTEAHWTKADLFAQLGLSLASAEAKTSQYGSGFLVLLNTRKNRDFLESWAEIATSKSYHFSDDSTSVTQNHPDFNEHRHDQSIASLLHKLNGTAITYYESAHFSGHSLDLNPSVPAWATRLRD